LRRSEATFQSKDKQAFTNSRSTIANKGLLFPTVVPFCFVLNVNNERHCAKALGYLLFMKTCPSLFQKLKGNAMTVYNTYTV